MRKSPYNEAETPQVMFPICRKCNTYKKNSEFEVYRWCPNLKWSGVCLDCNSKDHILQLEFEKGITAC